MAAALSALVEIICVERIANALSMVLYIYGDYPQTNFVCILFNNVTINYTNIREVKCT